MDGRILIVDDDEAVRQALRRSLEKAGYEIETAEDAFRALDLIESRRPDAVLLDLKMPGMDGMGLLENLRKREIEVPVVILTGHGDAFTARDCLEAGATAFLLKPPDRAELLLAMQAATARGRLLQEEEKGEEIPPLLGSSPAIVALRDEIARVAPSRATVLILGESGTGKEIVARRIHRLSGRARRPFIRVNCAAIPEELIESELFGHEKGAFTGAHQRQLGKFIQADGGTIFLDEVGDMSLKTQAKVLRVLQDGELEPVGSGRSQRVDVRNLAATNKNLMEEVAEGRFREDLYYRLAVILLHTPPLREHPEDLEELVEYFTDKFCAEYNRRLKHWAPRALEDLRRHAWPGNVRELINVVERAVIMERDDLIKRVDLPHREDDETASLLDLPELSLFQREAEKLYIRHHLEKNNWNIAATARAIGTPRSNLYKKLQAYDLKREDADDHS